MGSKKLFIVGAHIDDEWADVSPQVAVISISPREARLWLDRMDLASGLKGADEYLYAVEYWSSIKWLEHVDERFIPPWNQPIVLSGLPKALDEPAMRVVSQTANVLPNEVRWEGYIKHTYYHTSTNRLTRTDLQRVLAEA